MRLLGLDTETTGLFNFKLPVEESTLEYFPYVVQFSWIMLDTTTYKTTEYDYYIHCPIQVPPESTNCHGITTRMAKVRGHSFAKTFAIFQECMKQCDLIVGHNLHYDITVLKAECLRNQIPFVLEKPTYCTMKSTTKLCGLGKYPRLGFLHQFLFQEEAANLHSSMIDVLVCVRCYMKLMHSIDLCEKVKKLRRF
jgi:DNA polymerase III epsilon subunit-like protein